MKSIKGFLVILMLFLAISSLYSQPLSEKVLLTIANTPVTVDEFKSIYLKNTTVSTPLDQATFEDYLQLFINFKLKVQEAKNAKIDTSSAFIAEYNGYIKQLAQPYLTDAASDECIINEAYERMQYEVSASHILINVPETATPADTLKLYRKALDARARVLKGEPFGAVALATSNDPSVVHNSGYLGYFSAFQMVYPFESAAYNTPIDSVSMPVRTRFGYHVIKVHGRRPAQGQVKIAHILLRVMPNAQPQDVENARKKIVDIHTRILAGEDFAELARSESQDPGSAKNGGELPWLSSGQILPEMESVAFALSTDGQVSEPFQSSVGWHVVKRLGRKTVGVKDDVLPEIRQKIARDSRNLKSRESFIRKLKQEYGFREDTSKLTEVRAMLDSSLYKGGWKPSPVKTNSELFHFNGGSYTITNLFDFIAKNQRFIGQRSLSAFAKMAYGEWVNKVIIDYEESKLSEKYPEFKQLSKEYFEGMLLFEVTNQAVWLKSSDSASLANFYESRKSQYKWGERVHYAVYKAKDSKVGTRLVRDLAKRKHKNIKPSDFIAKFNTAGNAVTVEEKWANLDSPDITTCKAWAKGINVTTDANGEFAVFEILEITNGDIKPLNECRGQVVAEHQEAIESEWIEVLKAKYPVRVDEKVLSELFESVRNNPK